MPQHSPEDRVRVKNIISEELAKWKDRDGNPLTVDHEVVFNLQRYEKQPVIDTDGKPSTRDVMVEKESIWNYKNGFLFIWGQQPYRIQNGEEKTYKRFLADHCANHMINYILTRRYQASKKMTEQGPVYDMTILGNVSEQNRLRNAIIMYVEEWDKGNDMDLDRLLANEFGGDVDSVLTERKRNEDLILSDLKEIEQDEGPVKEVVKPVIKPTSDIELQKLRAEADQIGLTYTSETTREQLQKLILKEMA